MKKEQILIPLIAVALLVVVIIIVVRKRGRKVYLKDQYRLNNNYRINLYPEGDWYNGTWYQGTLDYVMVPYKPETVQTDGRDYTQVSAIGQKLSDGRVVTVKMKGKNFIETEYLNL